MLNRDPIFNYLETICEYVPAAFYWVDLNIKRVGLNRMCMAAIGITDKSEVIGKTPLEFYKDKEIGLLLYNKMVEVIKDNKETLSEDKIIDANGKIRYFSATRAPLKTLDGKIVGALGISVETTNQKNYDRVVLENEINRSKILELEKEAKEAEILQLKNIAELSKLEQENTIAKMQIILDFGKLAAKVSHDIASPLSVLQHVIKEIKIDNRIEYKYIQLLEESLINIKNTSNDLLNRYRKLSSSPEAVSIGTSDNYIVPRFIVLQQIIKSIIQNKNLEWKEKPCNIIFDNNDITWVNISPSLFTRAISNLFNNSYESFDDYKRNIKINILSTHDFISICIVDSGNGIAPNEIQKALNGVSSKHAGAGLGLSSAKEYFESIGGWINLESDIGKGTNVTINLPPCNAPIWFPTKIEYFDSNVFVVIDDNSSILLMWKHLIVTNTDLECLLFLNLEDFKLWYNSNKDSHAILFVDYDLNNKYNGLNIINEFKQLRSYLVTDHATESFMQNLAIENNFKLIPKALISSLNFVKME